MFQLAADMDSLSGLGSDTGSDFSVVCSVGGSYFAVKKKVATSESFYS
jgi:hypothetical protein